MTPKRVEIIYRPIDAWPGKLRRDDQRADTPFSASWLDTVDKLQRELAYIGATRAVMQVALPEHAYRVDGQLRSDARDPDHPGVIIAFDSQHGPLKYATDVYRGYGTRRGWQANARAIALGLESLRRVDRYGITSRGEQYKGWRAIESGMALPERAAMTREQAAQVVADLVNDDEAIPVSPGFVLDANAEGLDRLYKVGAKLHHPDRGGDARRFEALSRAIKVLQRA